MYKYIFFLSFIFVALSCENEIETINSDLGYEYFPLGVGYEWVYRVDSIQYFNGGNEVKYDTSYVKDEITEVLSENGDEIEYKLVRSYKPTLNASWRETDIWKIGRDKNRAYRVEENLRFIKLVFPFSEGTTWDGNSHFDSSQDFTVGADQIDVYDAWEYEIFQEDLNLTIDETDYPNSIVVQHVDNESTIDKRYSVEMYSKDFGLIEKHMEILETQNQNPDLSWEQKAQAGFIMNQYLISFNKN